MKKTSLSRKIFLAANAAILSLLAIICLYPMLYVLFASLSDSNLLMAHKGLLWHPLKTNAAAFKAVLSNPMIASGYINTAFVLIVGTTISLILTSLGAYFLSRRDVMLKGVIMALITFTMFFSGGLIPFYLTVKMLGFYNSLWALVIPTAISTYNMIIMRTSFMAIPRSLEEAATIDGADQLTIFVHVVLPLSKAIIAVMILYYGVGAWNGWFYAMVFLADRGKFPLQLVLREILIQNDTDSMTMGVSVNDGFNVAESVKYAVIVVATAPILCIYPFLQKYFVKGVMIGALKG